MITFQSLCLYWLVLTAFSSLCATCPALDAKEPEHNNGALELSADTVWVVEPDQPESVKRALEDVKRDWYKVFGHRPAVVGGAPSAVRNDPVIYLGHGRKSLLGLAGKPLGARESFVLRAQREPSGRSCIVATGADARGSIYAAYAFAEHVLGVDPWYYWTDHEPTRRTLITVPAGFDKSSGPPTFTWRGWFINDEDLLSGYAPDPLGENVFSLALWDRVYETLLRLRGNMVIPGTWTFPDERAAELASRRGLALSMHHVSTLGLNTMRWPSEVPFSYNRHPEIMERYWQQCIDAYKDREVVWTVGYRGKQDQPFWTYDTAIKTPQDRGAAITKAVARQVELIQKARPGAPMIINLWSEGVELIKAGYLKVPAGVKVVWADDGTGVVRYKDGIKAGDGIYYHTAMRGFGQNQLSEMVPPRRIHDELGRFIKAGATDYFLLNVSDVRPIPLSTDCAMRLAWDGRPTQTAGSGEYMDAFLVDWCTRQFGAQVSGELAGVYRRYFDIPYQVENRRRGENYLFNLLHELDREAWPLMRAGKPLDENCLKRLGGELSKFPLESLAYVTDLCGKAEALLDRIPQARRDFYLGHLVTQCRIHQHGLEMLDAYGRGIEAYKSGDKALSARQMKASLDALERVFSALGVAEYGKWAGWYQGEGLVGLEITRNMLRNQVASLEGAVLPIGRPGREFDQMAEYQKPFLKNFPLIYPEGMFERVKQAAQ